MATELWSADLQLRAVLDEQLMSLRDVMNLQVGQTISLNVSPGDSMEMRCGEVPMFRGKMGRSGQNLAVQVDDINRLKRRAQKE